MKTKLIKSEMRKEDKLKNVKIKQEQKKKSKTKENSMKILFMMMTK